jgi:uncharacterized protein
MLKDVVEVSIKGIMPTTNGCAIFLGPEDKTFIIYVDQYIGNAIQMAVKQEKKERPLTHDLIGNILLGLGVTLERIIINDRSEDTFYARIILRMENELGTKLVEVDARPSDSMALALQLRRPIFAAQSVLDSVEDMSELLERIQNERNDEEDTPF